jgi:hypothetical protein
VKSRSGSMPQNWRAMLLPLAPRATRSSTPPASGCAQRLGWRYWTVDIEEIRHGDAVLYSPYQRMACRRTPWPERHYVATCPESPEHAPPGPMAAIVVSTRAPTSSKLHITRDTKSV